MSATKSYKTLKNIAISLIALLLVLWISSIKHFRFDLTEERRFTLTNSTKEILSNLDDTIRVTVYLTGDLPLSFVKMEREVSDLLTEFQEIAGKDKFLFKFIDPQSIGDAKNFKHTISRLNKDYGLAPYTIQEEDETGKMTQRFVIPGMIISTSQKFVTINMLLNTMGNTPEEQINEALQDLEYQCVKSIKQLTAKERKNIAFLTGNGEHSLLYTYNATVALLDLYNVDRISPTQLLDSISKYDVIIVDEPTKAFSEEEKFIIDQYLMYNGNLLFLSDNIDVSMDSLKTSSFTYAMPKELNISDLLFNIGVRINQTILLDNQCAKIPMNVSNFGEQPRFAPVPWFYFPLFKPQKHIITKGIDVVKSEFASSLDTISGNGHLEKTILLTSSAYARVIQTPNMVGFNVLQNEPNKEFFNKYYVPTAVLIEGNCNSLYQSRKSPISLDTLQAKKFVKKDASEQNRIIVVSDGDIIRNEIEVTNGDTIPKPLYVYKYFSFDKRTYVGNLDFFVNAVSYLCGDDDLLSIRSREITIRLLNKNRIVEEKTFWQTINVLIPIILLAIVGVIVYFIRNRKFSKKYVG